VRPDRDRCTQLCGLFGHRLPLFHNWYRERRRRSFFTSAADLPTTGEFRVGSDRAFETPGTAIFFAAVSSLGLATLRNSAVTNILEAPGDFFRRALIKLSIFWSIVPNAPAFQKPLYRFLRRRYVRACSDLRHCLRGPPATAISSAAALLHYDRILYRDLHRHYRVNQVPVASRTTAYHSRRLPTRGHCSKHGRHLVAPRRHSREDRIAKLTSTPPNAGVPIRIRLTVLPPPVCHRTVHMFARRSRPP
jgi:hypothetical protein